MTEKQIDKLVDRLAGAMIKRIYGLEGAELTEGRKHKVDIVYKKGLGRISGSKTTFGQLMAGKSRTSKDVNIFYNPPLQKSP